MDIVLVIGAALISYLLGSISFAVILSRQFAKKDVRNYGSGNAGMTNVVRTAGVLPGILTLFGDFLKGAAAVAIGRYLIFGYLYYTLQTPWCLPVYGAFFCGAFCLLGHIFPIFFGFKGGKGVATAVGVMLIADWRALLIALGIFLVIFLITKIVSVGSIISAASLPASTYLFFAASNRIVVSPHQRLIETVLAGVLALIIIAKHKENILRILKGEEKPITSKGRG